MAGYTSTVLVGLFFAATAGFGKKSGMVKKGSRSNPCKHTDKVRDAESTSSKVEQLYSLQVTLKMLDHGS